MSTIPNEPIANGTASHFRHQLTTQASPSAVWKIWTAVNAWPQWDSALESAALDGTFALGATGVLKAKGSPKAHFSIEAFEEGKSYRLCTKLPLGSKLLIDRVLSRTSDCTVFQHVVRFEGASGWVLSRFLGPGYRRALPVVMANIKRLAEDSERTS
jgi:hypothetical protein